MSELIEYKCPHCGGAISYDPSGGNLKCPFCESELDIAGLNAYGQMLASSDEPQQMEWSSSFGSEWTADDGADYKVYLCKSCGGEIVCDDTTASSSCPYCGNPIVMKEELAGDLKPDFIIPFSLSKEQAKEKYAEHLKGKKLLPDVFKDENHIEEIKGMYVPVWVFDATADARMSYRAEKERTWSDSTYHYTETSTYAVERAGTLPFKAVPVDGSRRMDDALMESLEPFDHSAGKEFKTAFLAGFMADRYDVDAKSSIPRANERIRNTTASVFRSTVTGYSSVIAEGEHIGLKDQATKYALYPVWTLATNWNGQSFFFAMNGQTGKFVGDLPIDKRKVITHFILSFVIAFAIAAAFILMGFARPEAGFEVSRLAIALIIGLIAGFIVTGAEKSAMTSVRAVNSANEYANDNALKLSVKRDVFLYKNVSRTRRSSNTGQSGGRPPQGARPQGHGSGRR